MYRVLYTFEFRRCNVSRNASEYSEDRREEITPSRMLSSRVAITTSRVKMEWRGDAGADTDRYAFAASRRM